MQSVRAATAVAEVWSMPSVVFDRVMLVLTCAAIPCRLLSAGFARSGSSVNRSRSWQCSWAHQPGAAVAGLVSARAGPGGSADRLAAHLPMVAATAGPGRDVVLPLDGIGLRGDVSAGGGRCRYPAGGPVVRSAEHPAQVSRRSVPARRPGWTVRSGGAG